MMRSTSVSSPRNLYPRAGSFLVCHRGTFYGPKADTATGFDPGKEVRIVELAREAGSPKQITLAQGSLTETWVEKQVVRAKRG